MRLSEQTAPITGDPRFFVRTGPHSLAAVVDAARGSAPPRMVMLNGIAPLRVAAEGQVSFLDNRRYLPDLAATSASAVIVHPDMAASVPASAVAIQSEEPYAAWARVAGLFHPPAPVAPGRHPSAIIDLSAEVDPSAEIGALCVIGARAVIGPRCRLGSHVAIGEGVVLGADCRIGAHVSISHALLGARVCLFPGVRVGQDGFGFATTSDGFLSVPQLGRVILEHDVEIGANTTIDRGSASDTVIGAGSRIDNLVQIGHNVRIGKCCVIVSQVGISGSTELGDFVMIGGQAGIIGHLKIGSGVRIGGKAAVIKDVAAGLEVIGAPAEPARQHFRYLFALRRLVKRAEEQDKKPRHPADMPGDNKAGSAQARG